MELFSFGFLACLVSGFLCFWLFWKCVDWLEKTLTGAFCSREEIERRLTEEGVGGYIAGAEAAELAEFICP